MTPMEIAVSKAYHTKSQNILGMCEVHLGYAMMQNAKAAARRIKAWQFGSNSTMGESQPVTIFGQDYDSINEAAEDLGINSSTLNRHVHRVDLDDWVYQHLQKKRSGV